MREKSLRSTTAPGTICRMSTAIGVAWFETSLVGAPVGRVKMTACAVTSAIVNAAAKHSRAQGRISAGGMTKPYVPLSRTSMVHASAPRAPYTQSTDPPLAR